MDAEQWATIVTCNLVNWPSLHSHRLTYCYHLIYKNITGKLTAYVPSRLCLNGTNMNGFIYIKNVSILWMRPRRFWETKSLRVDYSDVALTVTFLSGDFMANTGMWQASSGHQSGAIVFPSFSPQSHPGEFSSPETKKKTFHGGGTLCCFLISLWCLLTARVSSVKLSSAGNSPSSYVRPRKTNQRDISLPQVCNMNGVISMWMS